MKRAVFTVIGIGLVFVALVSATANDTRQLVELPSMMRQHMLANMRDHLLAITEIQEALSSGAFDDAAEIAETRLGMSSLIPHGASHMAPYMPREMQEIGTQMHRTASQFAVVAQESAIDGDMSRAISSLSKIMKQCIACHEAYRVQ